MNIFLIVLEKILYGTFNDQDKLQNNFAYKCEFNEVFENKIKNLGLPHYLFQNMFYHNYCKIKLNFLYLQSNLTLKKRKIKNKKSTPGDSVNTKFIF